MCFVSLFRSVSNICVWFHFQYVCVVCSINKRDKRGAFLYVVSKYSDDFHIFFSSEAQCERYDKIMIT